MKKNEIEYGLGAALVATVIVGATWAVGVVGLAVAIIVILEILT